MTPISAGGFLGRRILEAERGVIDPRLLVILIAIAIALLLFIIYSVILYSRSPDRITLTPGTATPVAGGGFSIPYTATLTYAVAPTTAIALDIEIYEEDPGVDNLLDVVTVTVPASATRVSTPPIVLTCVPGRFFSDLKGTKGSVDFENEFQIYAVYTALLAPNTYSETEAIFCQD